jgi:hypothetical protein
MKLTLTTLMPGTESGLDHSAEPQSKQKLRWTVLPVCVSCLILTLSSARHCSYSHSVSQEDAPDPVSLSSYTLGVPFVTLTRSILVRRFIEQCDDARRQFVQWQMTASVEGSSTSNWIAPVG